MFVPHCRTFSSTLLVIVPVNRTKYFGKWENANVRLRVDRGQKMQLRPNVWDTGLLSLSTL